MAVARPVVAGSVLRCASAGPRAGIHARRSHRAGARGGREPGGVSDFRCPPSPTHLPGRGCGAAVCARFPAGAPSGLPSRRGGVLSGAKPLLCLADCGGRQLPGGGGRRCGPAHQLRLPQLFCEPGNPSRVGPPVRRSRCATRGGAGGRLGVRVLAHALGRRSQHDWPHRPHQQSAGADCRSAAIHLWPGLNRRQDRGVVAGFDAPAADGRQCADPRGLFTAQRGVARQAEAGSLPGGRRGGTDFPHPRAGPPAAALLPR